MLENAIAQADTVVSRVRQDQAALPTPCASWNVRELVNHIVDEVHQFAVVTAGGKRDHLGIDLLGDEWLAAYRGSAAELLAAWRDKEPDALVIGQHVTELVLHTWDVAKATGQSTELDPVLGEAALAWGHAQLLPEFRGEERDGFQVGAEVVVADDAPIYDRLAAFGGRAL